MVRKSTPTAKECQAYELGRIEEDIAAQSCHGNFNQYGEAHRMNIQSCEQYKIVERWVAALLIGTVIMLSSAYVWQSVKVDRFVKSRGPVTPGDVLKKQQEMQIEIAELKAELAETKSIVIRNRELAEANRKLSIANQSIAARMAEAIDRVNGEKKK